MRSGRGRWSARLRRSPAWAPGGWLRSGRYRWLQVLRLSDSPHRISRGVFAGVFIAFTPFFGLHFVLAPLLALLLNGSVMASLVAVLVCNPITFPAMAFASYRLGTIILEGSPASDSAEVAVEGGIAAIRENLIALVTKAEFDVNAVAEVFGVIFLPYLAGGLLLGAAAGTVLGWLSYRLISAYRMRRLKLRGRVGRRGGSSSADRG